MQVVELVVAGVILVGCAQSPSPSTPAADQTRPNTTRGAETRGEKEPSIQAAPKATNETILRVGGDVKAPRIIRRVAPEPVPLNPAKKYRQGVLILEMIIDETGSVSSVQVLRGASGARAEAVKAALRQWQFEPATLHGKPVKVMFNLTQNHFSVEQE